MSITKVIKCIFGIFWLILLSGLLHAQNGSDTLNMSDNQGKKNGYWKKYNDMDVLVYEGNFVHDVPQGEFIYYYPDGNIKARSVFFDEGQKTHTVTFYHSGDTMTTGFYSEQKKDSIWHYYDMGNNLVKKEFYRDGRKVGVWLVYFENGQVAEETTYKNDMKNGPWNQYYEDGTVKASGGYLNDQKHGKIEYFYRDGRSRIIGNYDHNLRTGEWLYLDEDSNVTSKEIYDEDGKLVKEKNYKKH